MKNLIKASHLILLASAPAVAFAQERLSGVRDLAQAFGSLINYLTIVVAGIALLVFFWGLARFILKLGGDAKAAEEGRKLMIWGVVALFVMVSVWGIIYFIGNQLFPGWGDDMYLAPLVPVFQEP